MKVLDSLTRWMGYVSAVAIMILMLLVVADISGRYFFNSPIMGASELASFIMIIVVFPALAWAALTDKHVKVDLLVVHFPPRAQAIFDSVTLLLALGAYIVITWRSILEAFDVHTVTSLLRLPQAPFHWIMTVGWVVFCLSIAALLIINIIKAAKR